MMWLALRDSNGAETDEIEHRVGKIQQFSPALRRLFAGIFAFEAPARWSREQVLDSEWMQHEF